MHGSPPARTLRSVSSWLAVLGLALAGSACDDAVTPEDDATVEGSWVATIAGQTLYLDITSSTVTLFEPAQDGCFYVRRLERVEKDGDTYTLRERGTEITVDVTLRLDGTRLVVRRLVLDGDTDAAFEPADTALSSLEECSVVGTWVHDGSSFVEYLEITTTTLTVYGGLPDACVSILPFDITSQSGSVYTLTEQSSGESVRVVIRVEGEQLSVANAQTPSQSTVYATSTQDVGVLEECGPGPDDPGIDCQALPAIAVGDSIAGELTTEDGSYSGWYYDLYGLTLDSGMQVQIDVVSDAIDAFLRVFDAGGTFLDGNDNATSATTNAAVIMELAPGCYRIEASSAPTGQTGPYTIRVN